MNINLPIDPETNNPIELEHILPLDIAVQNSDDVKRKMNIIQFQLIVFALIEIVLGILCNTIFEFPIPLEIGVFLILPIISFIRMKSYNGYKSKLIIINLLINEIKKKRNKDINTLKQDNIEKEKSNDIDDNSGDDFPEDIDIDIDLLS